MFFRKKFLVVIGAFFSAGTLHAQTGVRAYSQVFSQNIKGGTAIFGNTSMNIIENDTVARRKMNESGTATAVGGLGNSQYGNDNENMQHANIDPPTAVVNLFGAGSAGWRYFQPLSDATYGTSWTTFNNPSSWASGTSSFGYGGTQTTIIPAGKPSTYFVKTINIPAPSLYSQYNFTIDIADGAVIYVNGTEVRRRRMSAGTVLYNTPASGAGLLTGVTFSIPYSYFTAGNNIIAVELHKENITNSTAHFNMALSATTFAPINSSSATLTLPSGSNNIKFARLYWGGRIGTSVVAATPDTCLKIKIRKGASGAYFPARASAANRDTFAISTDETAYQSFVDVTSFLQANGSGIYSVADVPASTGSITGGGHYGGWCIIIAYENTSMPYNSVRIYDGFSQVYNGGASASQLVSLTGLNVPNNPLSTGDATMSTMVWEGDANLGASGANPAGDFVKINSVSVANSVNPAGNFWNGSISTNGSFVTTKNPNYYNQMGIDIDEVQVGTGYGILPGATMVNVEFGTEADQYFPSIFGFSIRMKDPMVMLHKTVTDISGNGFVESGEILTYTLSGINTGSGGAYNTTVTDSLPTNVTYVPGSLQIINTPGIPSALINQSDENDPFDFAFKGLNGSRHYVKFFLGEGASYNAGGMLPAGSNYTLQFKVKAQFIPGSIVNTARVSSFSQAGEAFTDDGTAVIGANGAPVSVTLFSFNVVADGANAKVLWTTENELNNSHFEVERSDDAVHFQTRGNVPGLGISASRHDYIYSDNINPRLSVVYYRLKIVGLDGRFAFTRIIPVRLKGNSAPAFNVFPNPFDAEIRINLISALNTQTTFRIISMNGEELMRRRADLQIGENIIILKDLGGLAKGSYILEADNGIEKMIRKLVKK